MNVPRDEDLHMLQSTSEWHLTERLCRLLHSKVLNINRNSVSFLKKKSPNLYVFEREKNQASVAWKTNSNCYKHHECQVAISSFSRHTIKCNNSFIAVHSKVLKVTSIHHVVCCTFSDIQLMIHRDPSLYFYLKSVSSAHPCVCLEHTPGER